MSERRAALAMAMALGALYPPIRTHGRSYEDTGEHHLNAKVPDQCRSMVERFSREEARTTRHTYDQCARYNANNCRDCVEQRQCDHACWLRKKLEKGGGRR